jgi:imidazolonepropionase-like amidohydrolase
MSRLRVTADGWTVVVMEVQVMRRPLPIVILLVLVASAVGFSQTGPSTTAVRPVVIRAGVLVDPDSGSAMTNQTIVVENGKVSVVAADVAALPGATVIDLSRFTVLPGVIDAHTHLCMDVNPQRDRGSYFMTTLLDPDSYRAIQGVVNARDMLDAGFTTVRDVGNEGNYACTSVRLAVEQGKIPGPTILNAGRIVAPFGGQFHLQPEKRGLAEPEYFFADTRDEMRKAIRENIHFGARLIKLVIDDQPYVYSSDDIRFMIDEARKSGLKVAAHVWTREGAHNAAMAGVASMEHLNGASDEDLELAKRNGVTAVFTPMPKAVLEQFWPPEDVGSEYAKEIDRLRSGYRIGIPIAFGSDAIAELPGLNRGTTAMQWINSYSAAGLPPKAILRAMTTNAAVLLGVEKERGAIRPKMAADIIATEGNPLDNIDALKRVVFVMRDGKVVKAPH